MNAETKAREIAKEIIKELWPGLPTSYTDGDLEFMKNKISAALRAEREEDAEIADEHNGCVIKDCYGGKCGATIAAAIRGRA